MTDINQIMMEQDNTGKVATNEESMDNLLHLVYIMTSKIVIPDSIPEDNELALLLKATMITMTKLTTMAMFHPELFAKMLNDNDVADVEICRTDKKEVLYS